MNFYKKKGSKLKKIFLICTIIGLLTGCAGNNIEPEKQISEIYNEAYSDFDDKNYQEAANNFLGAETQFPNSEWAADALIMAAYSQYMDDDFATSLMTINRFMRFHPGYKDVPYVMYLKGMNYYRQVSDVRREPGMSEFALQQFQQLVERFPNSEYAKNAENKIIILKNYIAGKVMYSARRDMKKQNWISAINRLQSVVAGAQETVQTPEALFRLTECYSAINLPEQVNVYTVLLRKNYPDNEWVQKLEKKNK